VFAYIYRLYVKKPKKKKKKKKKIEKSVKSEQHLTLSSISRISITQTSTSSQSSAQSIDVEFVNSVVRETLSSNRPQNQAKTIKRKLVGNSGRCLTSDEAVEQLQSEAEAKRQKIAEAGERKRESEERRAAKERENELKRTQSISKKQQRLIDEEKRKEFRALQKQNKNLKACSCNKKLADDKENKQLWLNCFKCYSWVCYDCLPAMFKTKTKSVYTCEDCSNSASFFIYNNVNSMKTIIFSTRNFK